MLNAIKSGSIDREIWAAAAATGGRGEESLVAKKTKTVEGRLKLKFYKDNNTYQKSYLK